MATKPKFDKSSLKGIVTKNPTSIEVSKPTTGITSKKDLKTAAVDQPKKKVGRPKTKTEETKVISIAVPVSILKRVEIAKTKYHGNLTEYINAIIAKDLDENGKSYQQAYDILNS